MTESQINKVRRFLGDPEMSGTIKEILRSKFLEKKNPTDVHILASQTLAVQLLEESWITMEGYRIDENKTAIKKQVGL